MNYPVDLKNLEYTFFKAYGALRARQERGEKAFSKHEIEELRSLLSSNHKHLDVLKQREMG